jgi:outer membrane protein, multidrug efflux system
MNDHDTEPDIMMPSRPAGRPGESSVHVSGGRSMEMRRLWAGLICAAMLGGCAVGPDYRTPETKAPSGWVEVETPATAPAGVAATQPTVLTTQPAEVTTWWESFNDRMLDSLVERAVASNLDLRVAQARISEARAARGVIAADLWPQVNLGASYTYSGNSLNNGPQTGKTSLGDQLRKQAINSAVNSLTSGTGITPPTPKEVIGQVVSTAVNRRLQGNGSTPRGRNLFQAGFDASWELDLFGGTRRAVEAADDEIAVAVEDHRSVLVTLVSEVALNYVQLRGFQRRLMIARENIRIQEDTLEVTQSRYKAGFTNRLDVTQAEAQLAATRSQIPLLKTAVKQTIYQLSVLLAQFPATLLSELEQDGPIPAAPPELPLGLPSDLLRRRPDIRSVERQLAAATAQIGVATADLFPKFALTGSFGPQSSDINRILDRSSLAWSIGPGMNWPIFDGWRIRSNIKVQDARQEQALATYEQTVLVAFQEVESTLTAYVEEQIRRRALEDSVTASQESLDLSNELYMRGLTDFLNVLESQRALYTSQDALVQSETAVITDLIALYKALGGGWEMMQD